jgi:hypothetical protein
MIPLFDQLPNQIQKDLEEMTQIEEMLIAPIMPIMSVYRLSGGRLINSGYCASFSQDIQPICDQLPKLPKDISLIVVQKKTKENSNKDFICNRYRLERILRFIIANNKVWQRKGIAISMDNLNALPLNGVPEGLNVVWENEEEPEIPQRDNGPVITENIDHQVDDEEESINHAYIEVDFEEAQQIDKIKTKINIPINQENKAINEFDYDGILTLAFPKLFPIGIINKKNYID